MDASAWIAVIAAVIALLSGTFTAVSAKATMNQAAEARQQTELQRKIHEDSAQPYVWADIAPDTAQGALLKLTLCNEGPTVATNIHVKFDPPLVDVFEREKVIKIQESIEAGISYLAPGRRVQWFLDVGYKFFEQDPSPTVTISVTCDGPYGPCHLNSYLVNIDYVRFSHDNPDGSLHRVAERIKELTKVVKGRQ
jgi:hypothetical protein